MVEPNEAATHDLRLAVCNAFRVVRQQLLSRSFDVAEDGPELVRLIDVIEEILLSTEVTVESQHRLMAYPQTTQRGAGLGAE